MAIETCKKVPPLPAKRETVESIKASLRKRNYDFPSEALIDMDFRYRGVPIAEFDREGLMLIIGYLGNRSGQANLSRLNDSRENSRHD